MFSLVDTQQTQLPALLDSDLPAQQTFYVWTDMYWWCGSTCCLEMDNVTIAVVLLRLSGNCHCSRTHVSVSILCLLPALFQMVWWTWHPRFRCPFIGLSLETDNVSASVALLVIHTLRFWTLTYLCNRPFMFERTCTGGVALFVVWKWIMSQ